MIKKTYSFTAQPQKITQKAWFVFDGSFAELLGEATKQSRSCAFYINDRVLNDAKNSGQLITIQSEIDGNDIVVTYITKDYAISTYTVNHILDTFSRIKCKKTGMNGTNFLSFFVPVDMSRDEEVKPAKNLYNSYLNNRKKDELIRAIQIEIDAAGAKAYDETKHISFLIRRLTVPVHDEYMAQVEVFDHNGIVYQLLVNKVDLDEFRHSDEAQKKYGKDIHGINYIAMLDNLYKNVIKKFCESAT